MNITTDKDRGAMNNDSTEIAALRRDVRELTAQVQDLVDAWNTARGMVKFVKLLGSLAASAAAVWALIRLGAHR